MILTYRNLMDSNVMISNENEFPAGRKIEIYNLSVKEGSPKKDFQRSRFMVYDKENEIPIGQLNPIYSNDGSIYIWHFFEKY